MRQCNEGQKNKPAIARNLSAAGQLSSRNSKRDVSHEGKRWKGKTNSRHDVKEMVWRLVGSRLIPKHVPRRAASRECQVKHGAGLQEDNS